MFFKRIEMHGFKSFAEPVTIEFDKGITCVVGPNGSGKSNISDAIRWVLGEQSPKMLRGSRMDDVIFAGTASRKSRGMAEVTLVLDNSTGSLPIEYSEVAITRRMYRSGESEYAINNNPCRMKDIRELIMDTGIGVDGYSLIGQGKISEIISNKTESIREIFEETAGIVSYRSKKAEAERKLASAAGNMERVTDIISEIESRIGGLKEDSEKATEYLKLRERYENLEVNITVRNIEDIEEKTNALKTELEETSKELEAFAKDKEKQDVQLREHREKIRTLDEEYQNTELQLRSETEKAGALLNEKNVSLERLNSMEKDSERLKGEIEDIEKRLREEEENYKNLQNKKEEIDKKYQELFENLNKEMESHGHSLGKRDAVAESIENKKNELFELSNRKSGWTAEKASLENLSANLDKSREELLASGKEGEGKIDAAKEQLSKFVEKEDSIKSKLGNLRKDYDSLLEEKKKETEIKEEALRLSAASELELGKVAARKRTIEEMESNYDGYNSGVRFVMRAGLKGIHGVVADLIDVPKGYETALETALGAAMQNVVCSDDKTAKTAINLLKDKKAGRITFLPVESVNSRGILKDRDVENAAGFAGYAAESVKFDEKYRTIMEYLLGSVVIIDNMDNAVRVSKSGKRGLRYVTLDGEVINASGAVTGGRYKNKSANIFERKSEIADLEKIAEDLEKKILEGRTAEEEAEKHLRKIAEKTAICEKEIRNAEIGLMDTSAQKTVAEKTIADLEKESIVWEDSLKDIQGEKEKLEEQIADLTERIEEADREIALNQEEILKDTEALENMAEDIKAAAEQLTNARIELNSWEREKENTDHLISISQQSAEAYKDDISSKEIMVKQTFEAMKGLKELIEEREEEIKILQASKEEKNKKLLSLSEEKKNSMTLTGELSDAGEELERKIRGLQDRKYEADVKAARFDGQLENLKNKLWEDFEISYAQALSMKDEDFVMSSAVKENRQIKNRIKELGDVNVGAIKEYEQVSERYTFLCEQRDDIQRSADELNTIISDTDKVIKKRFKESFDQVTDNFEKIFSEFFSGGHAKISLDNEEDPLNANIEITAQPPGKQLKNINLLSGGEKTMTAIALMFAVLRTKPTPCCILDEVEAALDDHNIHVFANYLKKFDNIQFTLITHQKTTMEHADVMYGVTMPERGVSKVYSLRMSDELPI